MRPQDRVDDPRARGGPRLGAAQRAGLAHGLVDRGARGHAVREGELVGADPQDVSHRGLQRAGPVQRAVDEPVEGAAALHRAVGQPGRLGAGPRVEAGPAGLGGQGPVGIGPPSTRRSTRRATVRSRAIPSATASAIGRPDVEGPRHLRRNDAASIRPLPGGCSRSSSSDPSPVAATSRPPSAASGAAASPAARARPRP